MEKIKQEKIFNIPNVLTMLRIAALPVLIWRFLSADRIGSLVIYVLVVLTDAADGFIARKTGKVTNFGKLMDPLADKLLLLTMLLLLYSDGTLPLWLVCVVILKELAMIIGGGFALWKGIVVQALPIGKVTTVIFALAVIALMMGWTAGKYLFGAAVVLMIFALVYYLLRMLRMVGMRK